MAGQKPITKKPTNPQEDLVIYKILVAVIIAFVAIFTIHQINSYYGYLSYMIGIYTGVGIAAIVLGAAAVVLACLAIALRKKPKAGKILAAAALTALLYALSALALRLFIFDAARLLYCFWVAAALLYAIYLLYQPEFFLISTLTTLAGGLFFYAARSYYGSFTLLLALLYAGLGILLILVFASTIAAARSRGTLSLAGRPVPVFVCGTPLMLYITCVVWAVCAVLVLLLGATFSYYCFFAAIIYELIAACYYTVKLR